MIRPRGTPAGPVDVTTGDILRFPSGNKSHPGRPHNFVVAIVVGTDVFAVPICSLRSDVKDRTCVIEPGILDDNIVWKTSYAQYAKTTPLTQASIRSQVAQGRLAITKCKPRWSDLIGRIADGLYDSRETPSGIRRNLPPRR